MSTEQKTSYQKVKEWRALNPEKFLEQRRRYRLKNKDRIKKYWNEWNKKKQSSDNKKEEN